MELLKGSAVLFVILLAHIYVVLPIYQAGAIFILVLQVVTKASIQALTLCFHNFCFSQKAGLGLVYLTHSSVLLARSC